MSSNLWNRVLDRVRTKVNSHSFNTWFRPTSLVSATNGTLVVRVPNPLFAEWLRKNYMPLILQILEDLDGAAWVVTFVHPAEAGSGEGEGEGAGGSARRRGRGASSGPQHTPFPAEGMESSGEEPEGDPSRYTFESFVVGSGNQFACAAARAVAEKPYEAYNPLYIYGGAGLGKTHLIRAIADSLARTGRGLKLRYVTCENFMNELVAAIRFEKTMAFRERFRSIDVLLVDDIQFLSGKERTQEEFFHTFNALYDARKQIVVTSDCPPKNLRSLEERLRSRVGWGLIADIQPPDLETKIAILKKKAAQSGVELPSDVALFIASKVSSNVRELEGYLVRVLAYASLNGREVDIETAKRVLQDIVLESAPVPTIEAIQKHVAEHFNLKVSQIKSKNNARPVAFPRQVAMYLCKTLTEQSLPEIGRKFGGKHHTTVLHAVRKIDGLRQTDRELQRVLHTLADSLR